ncbi:nibrin homolog isoform X1 [Magnolia sinica]|uniref:nibrin homolog isoform X1 n=1 Tax=Magnolia sinica TaxID=86752 RepID=UPI0026598440|nr:nibrin homolog isoform X1 [Magnolia sinica]
MVWGLFPAGAGGQKYYFFSKGTYKVGRKDCDVIIQNDRGVSRIHAELVVDAMTCRDPLQNMSDSFLSDVRIKDLSKYGTFINKEKGSKAVNELPNKETTLKNGDLVLFGSGNAVFRFCFVPLTLFIHSLKPSRAKPSLQDIISSIGGSATHTWNVECTHVIADESTSVTEDLINAILVQKPVVRGDWVKVVADKNIQTELPSWSQYVPNLRLDGVTIKITAPEVREICLAGHTLVLGSSHLYKFGAQLKSLLEMCSAKVVLVDEYCSSNGTLVEGASNSVVLVSPEGSLNEFNHFPQLISLPRVNDMKLVAAVLSGHFDPSIVESPSIAVSSQSTDETIVADSDAETDTVTSDHAAAVARSEAVKYEEKKEMSEDQADVVSEKKLSGFMVEDGGIKERKNKGDESETTGHQNSDIIYSQDLIVKDLIMSAEAQSIANKTMVNFKCFRKRETPSGNSFKDLIPFSKDPYKESDLGNEEVAEYVREEKKRKQKEAVAEDLFNSEKVKRRGAAGLTLRGLLTRG